MSIVCDGGEAAVCQVMISSYPAPAQRSVEVNNQTCFVTSEAVVQRRTGPAALAHQAPRRELRAAHPCDARRRAARRAGGGHGSWRCRDGERRRHVPAPGGRRLPTSGSRISASRAGSTWNAGDAGRRQRDRVHRSCEHDRQKAARSCRRDQELHIASIAGQGNRQWGNPGPLLPIRCSQTSPYPSRRYQSWRRFFKRR